MSKSIVDEEHALNNGFCSLFEKSIEKLKQKQAQDDYDRRMNAPDPECPPGHIKVDDAQRLSTLKQLQLSENL